MAPAQVRVPLMVWFALNVHSIKPAEAGAVIVKLLKVFAATICFVFAEVDENVTL